MPGWTVGHAPLGLTYRRLKGRLERVAAESMYIAALPHPRVADEDDLEESFGRGRVDIL